MGRQVIQKLGFDDYFRFLGFFTKDPITGCWNWRKQGNRAYGNFTINGVNYSAHRFSYIYHYGSVDEDLNVLHRCNNKKCVNPDHLYEGTQKVNIQQAIDDGRFPKGILHGRASITDSTASKIRDLLQTGVTQLEVSELTSVPIWTVSRIKCETGRFKQLGADK